MGNTQQKERIKYSIDILTIMSKPKTGKSRESEDYDEPSEQQLIKGIKEMPEPYRSYAAFSYLGGNRVSEAIGGKSAYRDRQTGELKVRDYSAVLAGDVQRDGEGWIEIRHIPTLKRKVKDSSKFYRDILIFEGGPGEKEFVDILMNYVNSKRKDEVLWNHSRKTQWLYCDQCLKIPPKILRSMRAKKYAKIYGFGALELKEIFNWGSVDMPFKYARYNRKALKDKMEQSKI